VISPLNQGLSRVEPADTDCREKALFSTRLDRYRKIVLPLAVLAFLGPSMIGGSSL